MIDSIDARPLQIPFKQAFAHASASRDAMQSIWVEARLADGTTGFGEGCPREYVTGETLEGALKFGSAVADDVRARVQDLDSLKSWVHENKQAIDRNPAAWCAIELALLDAFARRAGASVEGFLGLPELNGKYRYTAVIGDGSAKRFQAELARYREAGFRDFKIKLSGDPARDGEKVAALKSTGIESRSVRADANNLWPDADLAVAALRQLEYGFWALEEPLKAGDLAGMARIASETGAAIILDESLLREDQVDLLSAAPASWIANLRISKMGGLLRSLQLVERARAMGLRIIVGAHVGETSFLTRAALTAASAASDALVGQEGAFGTHLLERDVVDPSLMFGPGGVLAAQQLPKGPGFGIGPSI